MVVPRVIEETSALDPLLLLPIPSPLPKSPQGAIDPLLAAVEQTLQHPSPSNVPITTLTAHMRQVSRHAHVLLNAARAGAAEAREALDRADVELRGVEYERNRVRAEIAGCDDYSPVYKEMDLGDETSLSAAPSGLPPDTDGGYEHALAIARLEDHLAQIEAREATLARLTTERDAVIKSNKEIKTKFASTDSYLADFAKSTQAMAKKIGRVANDPPSL